ncbi:DUF1476 family protein [Chelatococcus sambhunathii]|uniref:DUF1476 family protein n=1 Tax=Chelatococcus sambhunathii TaxID=363953 RepID=A0ABU1DGM2_9HYPH|nr:ATPase inhibitor subunit zeta [Chelatococcus sambhunathii]MDR4307275.1 DUF1476 family protein [Chelatococcus sambhunathii]
MLDARERAAEAGFAHERDAEFQAHARRDRTFGRWVARLIGLRGEAAEEYARDLMLSNIERKTDETLIADAQADLARRGVSGVKASEERLRRKLERLGALKDAHPRG